MSSQLCVEKAVSKIGQLKEKECDVCRGTGIQDLIVNKSYHKIKCCTCDGTGQLGKDLLFRAEVYKHIWCECDNVVSVYSEDGVKVFGNDTYLCNECGMVVQFG